MTNGTRRTGNKQHSAQGVKETQVDTAGKDGCTQHTGKGNKDTGNKREALWVCRQLGIIIKMEVNLKSH